MYFVFCDVLPATNSFLVRLGPLSLKWALQLAHQIVVPRVSMCCFNYFYFYSVFVVIFFPLHARELLRLPTPWTSRVDRFLPPTFPPPNPLLKFDPALSLVFLLLFL